MTFLWCLLFVTGKALGLLLVLYGGSQVYEHLRMGKPLPFFED